MKGLALTTPRTCLSSSLLPAMEQRSSPSPPLEEPFEFYKPYDLAHVHRIPSVSANMIAANINFAIFTHKSLSNVISHLKINYINSHKSLFGVWVNYGMLELEQGSRKAYSRNGGNVETVEIVVTNINLFVCKYNT